ncbi:hypothetical protein [Hymenobacter sp.]|uniref:hypothetical protein n=1 Tax=Hymenobacter sp. TaxID=1898978 RepID=UPI002ED79D64
MNLTLDPATQIAATSAKLLARFADKPTMEVASKGFCWSINENPTRQDFFIYRGKGGDPFEALLTQLAPNTSYHVRAFATGRDSAVYYSNDVLLKTLVPSVAPLTVSTGSVTAITTSSAAVAGSVSGTEAVVSRGICWSTTADPTTTDFKTSNGGGAGAFSGSLAGLQGGVTYYARAYAVSATDTYYGSQVSFTTTSPTVALTLTTSAATAITASTATVAGSITGMATVTERGICWATGSVPIVSDSRVLVGSGTGSFTGSLTNLLASTTYTARSYATTGAGTVYGNTISFTTAAGSPASITVVTGQPTNIAVTSATLTGSVSGGSTSSITNKGVCWGTTANPTIGGNRTQAGAGPGAIASNVTTLVAGTTYYLRAYALTGPTTAVYGSQVTFTTPTGTVSLTTDDVNVYQTFVSVKGTATGTAVLREKGFCYSLSPNPTTANTKVVVFGMAPAPYGTYTTNLNGLLACTRHYVRAYAISTAGITYYGNELNFRPLGILTDCHPFNGLWSNPSNTIVYRGNMSGFVFNSFTPVTDKLTFYNALQKGLIGIGGSYITQVVSRGNNVYGCSILWLTGNSTTGVAEVRMSPNSVLTVSQDERTITISSNSPFTSGVSSTAVLTKQ